MKRKSIYADTSFLMSYFINDSHTEAARHAVSGISIPISVSRLGCLEFQNSVWRKVGTDGFRKEHAERAVREFEGQIEGGWFELAIPGQDLVWKRAMGIATVYSSELKVRSLDILHVAEALENASTGFWGFDDRQNSLAAKTGLMMMERLA